MLILRGEPVEIRYQADLVDTAGNAGHASTFIRRRLIILDEELAGNKSEHKRILLHEVAHFIWVRLGNQARVRWEELLRLEAGAGAKGEAGWSAEWRKQRLKESDRERRTRRWREYCCESFCDSAAWYFGGCDSELTLAPRYCRKRGAWIERELASRPLPI